MLRHPAVLTQALIDSEDPKERVSKIDVRLPDLAMVHLREIVEPIAKWSLIEKELIRSFITADSVDPDFDNERTDKVDSIAAKFNTL
jgi:hypothetical protein